MAIWDYKFYFMPLEMVVEAYGHPVDVVDDLIEDFNFDTTIDLRKDQPIDLSILEESSNIFTEEVKKKKQYFLNELEKLIIHKLNAKKEFEDLDGYFLYDCGKITVVDIAIIINIDLRRINKKQFDEIIGILNLDEVVTVETRSGKVLKNIEEFKNSILDSRAYTFVDNPQKFFEGIQK